jgi:hypothetical protein
MAPARPAMLTDDVQLIAELVSCEIDVRRDLAGSIGPIEQFDRGMKVIECLEKHRPGSFIGLGHVRNLGSSSIRADG